MAYTFKQDLASTTNYSSSSQRIINSNYYIVWHYTANDGDSDEANGRYFKTGGRNASAHAFIDDDSITLSVPLEYAAWSVGGNKWSDCGSTGGGKLYGIATNKNTINLELCDTKRNGKYDVSDATLENAITYTKQLMKLYNIPISHVIRHFDVNGKHCPAWAMDDTTWNNIKAKIAGASSTNSAPKKFFRIQIGAFRNKANAEKLLKEIKAKGFDCIIKQYSGLYKCQIGAYSIETNAKKQLEKLKKAGYKDAFITYN